MRKAFNFYRSYWEAAEDLSPLERLKYYEAIIKRQFTGEETELTGIAKIVYKGQKHSIDAQILGYEAKKGPLIDPCQGGSQGGSEGGCQAPSVQEKEKGKEKEQEKGEGKEKGASAPDHPLIQWLKQECPDVQKLKEPLTNDEAEKLVTRYPSNVFIKKVFTDMDNWKPLLQKRKSAYKTFITWANKDWPTFKADNNISTGKRVL